MSNNERVEILHRLSNTNPLIPLSTEYTISSNEKEFNRVSESLINYFFWMQAKFKNLKDGGKLDLRDIIHMEENLERVRYQLHERLFTIIDPKVRELIFNDIRNAIVNFIYSIFRVTPKYYITKTGEIRKDENSHMWAPEFYKIARAWPLLKSLLIDKEIFDPFAGAGNLSFHLVGRGIIKRAVLGDLSYFGGSPLNGDEIYYDPFLNFGLYSSFFNGLPELFKPDNRRISFLTMNALNPAFGKRSFDYILTDPPYGKNLNDGGIKSFLKFTESLLPLARKGIIYLIPQEWNSVLINNGFNMQQLTNDLSLGQSKLPTNYVLVRGG
jgi:16S rRNA G966 N2-methylase RsmD